jgi:hypothetical protein
MKLLGYYKYENATMKSVALNVYQQLGLPSYNKVYNQDFLTNFTLGPSLSFTNSVQNHIFVYKTASGSGFQNILPTSELMVYDDNGIYMTVDPSNFFVQSSNGQNWQWAIDGLNTTLYQSDLLDTTQDLSLDQFYRVYYNQTQKISRVRIINFQQCCRSRLASGTIVRIVAAGGINVTGTIYDINSQENNIVATFTEGWNYLNRRTGDIFRYTQNQTLRLFPFGVYQQWGAPYYIEVHNEAIFSGIPIGSVVGIFSIIP